MSTSEKSGHYKRSPSQTAVNGSLQVILVMAEFQYNKKIITA